MNRKWNSRNGIEWPILSHSDPIQFSQVPPFYSVRSTCRYSSFFILPQGMKSEGQKVCMAPPRRAPPCHRFNAIVLRSGWTSRGFSLTSKKEAVTYGSSFYAANPKRKRRTPRPSRSRPPKVITRLMMALWKNAHALEVCMISQRQAGFDRNPAKLKDRGQNVVCICGERAKRLLDRWRTI